MNYKLAAIDIDGTLLTDDYSITGETKKTLHLAEEQGVTVVMCSGRGPFSVIPILEELELDGYLITHNGAVVTHSKTREILWESGFYMDDLKDVVSYCRASGIHTDFCSPFEMYTETLDNEEVNKMYAKYLATPKLVDDALRVRDKIVKFTLFGSDEQLTKAFADIQAMQLPIKTIRSGPYYIDIIEKSTSKGTALRHLADKLGISMNETIAIGNYYNDLEMIHAAGVGVAVENAPEDVKREADLIVASNNDNGVADAIRRLILEKAKIR
ncbi:Cof-type HAD-IIB family hydrolase [Aneurinibacillus terranovensis]|uniref:Cof-type HAD-IIB family hydrolase n=1 Tax=Aneurinibacillus terranovensis TaxID=278991 RepID=UPI0004058A22|nr:Cof-type HAD-IIB family hydrolase [Aneurinibacillus terranovensis]